MKSKKEYNIKNMTCASCVFSIEKVLEKTKGVNDYSVSLIDKTVKLEFDDKFDEKTFEKNLLKSGFKINKTKKSQNTFLIVKMTLSLVFGFLLFFFSMAPMFKIVLPSIINPKTNFMNYGLLLLSLTVPIVSLNYEIYLIGYKLLFKLKPNMDSLIAIATTVSFIYSVVIMIMRDSYKHYYFESSGVVLALVSLGRFLEEMAKKKTKRATNSLKKLIPDKVQLKGDEDKKLIGDIKLNDIVIVKNGEVFPLDGKIILGTGMISEAVLTGEAKPIYKTVGDSVVGGSTSIDGYFEVEVTKEAQNGFIANILNLVMDAESQKPRIQKLADKISRVFVPAIIILSLIGFLIWFLYKRELFAGINTFVSVLTVACPCALGLATPTAIVTTTGTGARHGILFKTPEAIEKSARITAVAFDKTGTLTEGSFKVKKIVGDKKYLEVLYSLEKNTNHPISLSIINYLENKGIKNLKPIEDFKVLPGLGITGKLDSTVYYLGNKRLLNDNGIKVEETGDDTTVYLANKEGLLLTVYLSDTIKEDSKRLINELKKLKIKTYLLTGDKYEVSSRVQKELGIDFLYHSLLPEEKLKIIKELNKTEKVLMVGDGVNDAPSLMASYTSTSIIEGTDIAMESADTILITQNIFSVIDQIRLAKLGIRIIGENLFWAFFYNCIGVVLALGALYPLGITFTPTVGALAMAFSSVSVVLNALRVGLFKTSKTKEK